MSLKVPGVAEAVQKALDGCMEEESLRVDAKEIHFAFRIYTTSINLDQLKALAIAFHTDDITIAPGYMEYSSGGEDTFITISNWSLT